MTPGYYVGAPLVPVIDSKDRLRTLRLTMLAYDGFWQRLLREYPSQYPGFSKFLDQDWERFYQTWRFFDGSGRPALVVDLLDQISKLEYVLNVKAQIALANNWPIPDID